LKQIAFFLIVNLLATPLWAATVLSREQFSALVDGKTLYFKLRGQRYGAEQYQSGQKSIWRYGDGTCTDGKWYARAGMICFVYRDDPTEQCWRFFKKDGAITARADGGAPGDDLSITGADRTPVSCKAPDLGV